MEGRGPFAKGQRTGEDGYVVGKEVDVQKSQNGKDDDSDVARVDEIFGRLGIDV